jgi:phosphate transport system protein
LITFDKHAFKGLDAELSTVHESAQRMASLIQKQLAMFNEALADGLSDNSEAKALDKEINATEYDIEMRIAGVLSKYTLIGDDLRFAMTMLKLSSTLERMGDMAKNCVKRALKLTRPLASNFVSEALTLSKLISQMIEASMSLITTYDESKAVKLLAQEDEADSVYKKIQLMVQQNESKTQLVETTHMLFILKNLERLADLSLDNVKLCYYIHHGTKFEKP